MKPALVLGLALAANAFSPDQYDNELIIAPTDQFGNIKPYPRNIRYDEQADDELLVRPLSTHIAADDELRIAPTDEFGGIKQYPRNIRFDEDGRELFIFKIPRYRNLTNRSPGIFLDDEADDELMMSPFRRRFDDVEERRIFDDETGNELFAGAHGRLAPPRKSHPGLAQFTKKQPGIALNNQDDDELFKTSSRLFVDRQDEALRRDDDKLLLRLINNNFADDELIKPPKRPHVHNMNTQQKDDKFLVRPVVPYVTADDELHRLSPKLFSERQRQAEAMRRDDEADDELGYLDELLKEAPYNGAIFRAIDDELRAEKLGHLKGQKSENLKDDEMFEMRGKVRPFLPFS